MNDHHNSRCENCIIRQMNSFKALKKEELKRMADHTRKPKSSRKVKLSLSEGERLGGVFCVRNGVSKLSKMSDNGRDQIVKACY